LPVEKRGSAKKCRGERRLNILLAEDDKNFGAVMKKEMEEENYTVDLVHDGVQVVLSSFDKKYDLVLIDIMMPKLDGINALRIIKKINPDVSAIIFSGNMGHDEIEESLKAGACGYFTKPFEIAELRNYIEQHLKR
jgi:DNA-binding response OmpR family regulator